MNTRGWEDRTGRGGRPAIESIVLRDCNQRAECLNARAGRQHDIRFTASSAACLHQFRGWNALHFAAQAGFETAVVELLAQCPEMAGVAAFHGWTALHFAAQQGHDKIVTLLIAQVPQSLDVPDRDGQIALHYAVMRGHEKVVSLLLDTNPDQAHRVDQQGNTLLHIASFNPLTFCEGLTQKVYEVNTNALHAVNSDSKTPLQVAIGRNNKPAVAWLQRKTCWDDIWSALVAWKRPVQPIRELIEQQCEPLSRYLNQDVLGLVYEYVGVPPARLLERQLSGGFVLFSSCDVQCSV